MKLLSSLYGPLATVTPGHAHLDLRLELDPTTSVGLLGIGAAEPMRVARPAQLLARLIWTVNRHVIDAPPAALYLHAGAVADARANAAILAGPSETGKTTLTTGLLRRGLAYMTDEAARITTDLGVDGYQKPLSIDRGAWSLFPELEPSLPAGLRTLMEDQWQVPPAAVSSTVGSASLAVIVLPTYEPGAPTSLHLLHPIDALDKLRSCVFGPGIAGQETPVPAPRIRELAAILERVPSYRLISGDLETACDAVQHVLDEPSLRPPETFTAAPHLDM